MNRGSSPHTGRVHSSGFLAITVLHQVIVAEGSRRDRPFRRPDRGFPRIILAAVHRHSSSPPSRIGPTYFNASNYRAPQVSGNLFRRCALSMIMRDASQRNPLDRHSAMPARRAYRHDSICRNPRAQAESIEIGRCVTQLRYVRC